MKNEEPNELVAALILAMAKWESSAPVRLEASRVADEEGHISRLLMQEYDAVLAKYCTSRLIGDKERRRITLHFRNPSVYTREIVESCGVAMDGLIPYHLVTTHDKKRQEIVGRYEYWVVREANVWRLDLKKHLPVDGTAPFTIGI